MVKTFDRGVCGDAGFYKAIELFIYYVLFQRMYCIDHLYFNLFIYGFTKKRRRKRVKTAGYKLYV